MKVSKLKKLLFFLWPPYEANFAKHQLNNTPESTDYDKLSIEIDKAIDEMTTDNKEEVILQIAKEINDRELKRKETIENKASSFLYAVGLSITVISLVFSFLRQQEGDFEICLVVALVVYVVSFIFLFTSAYYAVKVRQIKGFFLISADTFLRLLDSDTTKKYTVELISNTKKNEIGLCEKANYLSVAESLFLRGIASVAFASLMIIVNTLNVLLSK